VGYTEETKTKLVGQFLSTSNSQLVHTIDNLRYVVTAGSDLPEKHIDLY